MRPPSGEPEDREDVLTRRDGTVTRFAAVPFVRGTLRHRDDRQPYGEIVVIESSLTDDIPWDVRAHAEKNPRFPNDSTINQFFSDRQFESYRELGHHQMSRALEVCPLTKNW